MGCGSRGKRVNAPTAAQEPHFHLIRGLPRLAPLSSLDMKCARTLLSSPGATGLSFPPSVRLGAPRGSPGRPAAGVGWMGSPPVVWGMGVGDETRPRARRGLSCLVLGRRACPLPPRPTGSSRLARFGSTDRPQNRGRCACGRRDSRSPWIPLGRDH